MDKNIHIIQGRLGVNPKILRSDSTSLARLRVATNRSHHDANGNRTTKTTWHTILVLGHMVDQIASARKGDGLFVVGYVDDHEWTDRHGVKRQEKQIVATEISRPLHDLTATSGARSSERFSEGSGQGSRAEQQPRQPVAQESQRQPERTFDDRPAAPASRTQRYEDRDTPFAPAARREDPRQAQRPVEPHRPADRGSHAAIDDLPEDDAFADLEAMVRGGSYAFDSDR